MVKKQAKRYAPYVAAGALSEFFSHIRTVSEPRKIDRELLAKYGVDKGNIGALLSALKFLKILENDGATTPAFRMVQATGDEFRNNLAELVRKAYADVWDSGHDPAKDNRENLRNYFGNAYSFSIAKKATILFLDLCKEAGIPVKEETIEVAAGTKIMKDKGVKTVAKHTKEQGVEALSLRERYLQRLIESDLNITIAPGMDADAIKAAREALQERHQTIKEMLDQLEER